MRTIKSSDDIAKKQKIADSIIYGLNTSGLNIVDCYEIIFNIMGMIQLSAKEQGISLQISGNAVDVGTKNN